MLMNVDWLLEKETWVEAPPAGKRWVGLWVMDAGEKAALEARRSTLREHQIDAWYEAHNAAVKKRYEEEKKKKRLEKQEKRRLAKVRALLKLTESGDDDEGAEAA